MVIKSDGCQGEQTKKKKHVWQILLIPPAVAAEKFRNS
jgi:hypothetical protein